MCLVRRFANFCLDIVFGKPDLDHYIRIPDPPPPPIYD
jgi:hypothetical protein